MFFALDVGPKFNLSMDNCILLLNLHVATGTNDGPGMQFLSQMHSYTFKNLCTTFFTPAETQKSANLWLPFVFSFLF